LRLEQQQDGPGSRDGVHDPGGGVRPGAQPDPGEGEPRAPRPERQRPALRSPRGEPFHGLPTQQGAARRPGRTGVPGEPRHLGDPVSVDPFPPNSRYRDVGTATLTLPGGRIVVYLRRRLAPLPERLSAVGEVTVTQGDRLDLIAAAQFGDPELAWRICDANAALRPQELTERIGRRLRITLPEGVPGGPGA